MKFLNLFFWGGLIFIFPNFLMAADTVIKGGSMELVGRGERVLFKDGVRMERGNDVLKATKMETTKNREQIYAYGNVQLFRKISDNETMTAKGTDGYYDTDKGTGYLKKSKGRVHSRYREVVNSTTTRILDVYAVRFDFNEETSTVIAKGNVYGTTVDPETKDKYEFWSDQANYDGQKNQLYLSGDGKPRVHQTGARQKRDIVGDEILYNVKDRSFVAEGNAKAVFIDEKGSPKE